MTKHKFMLTLVFSICVCCSLTACGDKSEASSSNNTSSAVTTSSDNNEKTDTSEAEKTDTSKAANSDHEENSIVESVTIEESSNENTAEEDAELLAYYDLINEEYLKVGCTDCIEITNNNIDRYMHDDKIYTPNIFEYNNIIVA